MRMQKLIIFLIWLQRTDFISDIFQKTKKICNSVVSNCFPVPRNSLPVSIIRMIRYELLRFHFKCKENMAKSLIILDKIKIDGKLLKGEFNILINKLKFFH